MKGRLRNVKISEQQDKFARFDDTSLANLDNLCAEYDKFILEFCCGTGDFLVEYASIQPKTFFIGIDYAENAIFRALKKAYNKKLNNCKFYNGYIQQAMEYFKEEFFDIIYISFPDPWPKYRHTNRRLVTTEFLNNVFKIIKKDGFCIVITDNKWYQDFIDYQLNKEISFIKYFNESWYTEDEERFLSTFCYFPSNYYKKAKEEGNIIRYYILKKK